MKYQYLLQALHTTPFRYFVNFDENRMADGINLRYRYYYEQQHGYNNIDILKNNDQLSCSVLEMMVALALRCDEEIMYDFDIGQRIHVWFFEMLKNLGLSGYTNDIFNPNNYSWIIERFLNRTYAKNGEGGLFVVNTMGDIRNVEIWYQLCWFLEENYEN